MTTAHTTHSKEHGHKHAGHAGAKHETSGLNVEALLERFRLPGIDVSALMEAQRKNVQALQEANQKAYSGALALAQRQAEIFEETMREWQHAAKDLTAKKSDHAAAKPADLAQKAVEQALGNMRELAEMAVKSQVEAYEVIGKRVQAGIEELRDYLVKK